MNASRLKITELKPFKSESVKGSTMSDIGPKEVSDGISVVNMAIGSIAVFWGLLTASWAYIFKRLRKDVDKQGDKINKFPENYPSKPTFDKAIDGLTTRVDHTDEKFTGYHENLLKMISDNQAIIEKGNKEILKAINENK